MPFAQVIHGLKVQKARRPYLAAIGFIRTICHQIHPKLTLWRFNRRIDFALGHMEALGVKFEVMNQSFHRLFHLAAFWRGHFSTRHDIARFLAQFANRLFDNRNGLAHFFHAAQIAVITVAIFTNRNVKLKLVIAFIGLRATQIPSQARAAHHYTAKAIFLNVVFCHDANICVALLENPIFCQHRVDVLQNPWEGLGPFFDIIQQSIWQILMHTAGAEIGRMQTRTTGPLIKDHQLFALFKPPGQRRHRPHIHGLRRDIEQMVEHAANFRIKHADQAGAPRHDSAGELFNRQTPCVLLVHRCHIV